VERDACALCDGTIDRFDRHVFAVSGHCGGCAADLAS
jgi:hypothetical protein